MCVCVGGWWVGEWVWMWVRVRFAGEYVAGLHSCTSAMPYSCAVSRTRPYDCCSYQQRQPFACAISQKDRKGGAALTVTGTLMDPKVAKLLGTPTTGMQSVVRFGVRRPPVAVAEDLRQVECRSTRQSVPQGGMVFAGLGCSLFLFLSFPTTVLPFRRAFSLCRVSKVPQLEAAIFAYQNLNAPMMRGQDLPLMSVNTCGSVPRSTFVNQALEARSSFTLPAV